MIDLLSGGAGGMSSSATSGTGQQSQGNYSVGNMTFSTGAAANDKTQLYIIAGIAALYLLLNKRRK